MLPAGRRLLIASAVVIGIATLLPTGAGSVPPCILCADRGLSDFLANILLFAPFGFALARRGWSWLHAIAIACAASLGIEIAQLLVITGRHANIGDLIANTAGGALGSWIGRHRMWWVQPEPVGSRRWLVMLGATLAFLIGGLMMFIPSFPASPYYMQWTADLAHLARYDGQVLAARLGPLDLPGGPIAESDSVRRMLLAQPLEFTAIAALPRGIAPIVSIYDDDQRQIMLLGAARADLIYRHRMLADELRLDRGDIRVHQAFEDVPPGSTFRLVWTVDRAGYCLELDGRMECGRGFTVGDTWTLFMALDWGTDERAVLRTMWLWLLFVPTGLLATRVQTLLAAMALTGAVLVTGPLLLGFALTPLYQVLAATLGLATGRALANRHARRSLQSPRHAPGVRPAASARASPTSAGTGSARE